ncbi:hypothetical protein SAMN02745671_02234 [Anaerovibrio lipolyticus DSM 3074]|uniref:Uncharacterized protein n=1 Tax=Anaerovibrio lipolyticus DSM 3074 TaxID=1120997 RepID=A0A1M6FDV4_9FIRM|nr:hypothetical protein [Anaerovibrio lipolyticus]SHI95918.1 hypothetical protein SAMN02745671_02234 [Anaerovibrio lipolyticus DSM 3074]
MNHISVSDAKGIMGKNMIGPEEIDKLTDMKLLLGELLPEIQYSRDELEKKKEDYILILGIGSFNDGSPVTIRNMKKIVGMNPELSEPCFYNQDWYNKEDFIDIPMRDGWFLIRKEIYEESRAIQPLELKEKYNFPSAISCTYAFFMAWYILGIKLWYHDFVWCSDTDHNGDRIYVGKYHDVDGVNKNGFSIHRHLALRPCYGCID